ncbi:MAG TPA: RNA-binding S4 domain-containing protein [Oscillospiraceae bacterium]|nr:RNA-binding S4 domain-containing protein [Oscillospiraceae bacterium]
MRIKKQINIEDEYIKLDQLLKLGEIADSGGHAKLIILNGDVRVNGQTVIQRGKKIRAGDRITYDNIEIEVL